MDLVTMSVACGAVLFGALYFLRRRSRKYGENLDRVGIFGER